MKPADAAPMCMDPRVYMCTRFRVNYSIIAVDILLFVAVVDRRPAAESGSASDPFRAANSCDVARAFPRRDFPARYVAVPTVIFAVLEYTVLYPPRSICTANL